ncbi:MAG: methylmalonyl-CoA mutase family protein, partial [Pseudomonadota bacterium]
EARAELATIDAMGGAIAAIEYMKGRLVEANSARVSGIETGDTVVVGVNAYTASEPSPLVGEDGGIMVVDTAVEADQITRLQAWRGERDGSAVREALAELRRTAAAGENIMPASIAAAKAGATTGEWSGVMREIHGQYRGPTGVSSAVSNRTEGLEDLREAVDVVSDRLGRRLKFLMGKPGLDGHSNGAEQIACRARDCGMAIAYEGIRLTPAEIVAAAVEERPHVLGLSVLSGSHVPLVATVMRELRAAGLGDLPVIVGGIIPDQDVATLKSAGVSAVYTPKDFELNRIMLDIVNLADPDAIAAE